MWIKTQGGYLLNLDKVDYVICNDEYTKAVHSSGQRHTTHIISEGNTLDSIYDNINRGTKIMEVR